MDSSNYSQSSNNSLFNHLSHITYFITYNSTFLYFLNTYFLRVYILNTKLVGKPDSVLVREYYPSLHLQNNFFKNGWFFYPHPLDSFSLSGVHDFSCKLLSLVQ